MAGRGGGRGRRMSTVAMETGILFLLLLAFLCGFPKSFALLSCFPAFADQHDVEKLKAAIKAGKFSLATKDSIGKDALLTASDFVRVDVMTELLDQGASLASKDYMGNTAFHYVLKQENEPKAVLKALKMLLKRNGKAGKAAVDINAKNMQGERPIDKAFRCLLPGAVKLLVKLGADDMGIDYVELMKIKLRADFFAAARWRRYDFVQ